MAWTAPVTWSTGQLVGATDLNAQIRDNLSYLLNGRLGGIGSGTITTSSAAYVDVDSTNCKATFTPNGSVVLVISMFNLTSLGSVGQSAYYDMALDGTPSGNATLISMAGGTAYPFNTAFWPHVALFTSVTPGVSHTFKAQVKTTNTISLTAYMFAREIG